jgi:hypothetical protein
MSFSSKISSHIDSVIQEFCEKLSKKYNVPKSDLYSCWNNQQLSSDTEEKKVEVVELTVEKANTSTKDFLMAFCKSKGLKQSGTKDEVLKRVLEHLDKNKKSDKVEKIEVKKVEKSSQPSIVKALSEKSSSMQIQKNKFGNYEHFESGLVFNNDTGNVIGFQNKNGKVDSLTDETIELCKKYKFTYKLPENLNVNKGLSSVKVEDLEDEDEDELDEDDIEEEEEELDNEVDLEED